MEKVGARSMGVDGGVEKIERDNARSGLLVLKGCELDGLDAHGCRIRGYRKKEREGLLIVEKEE